MNMICEIGGVFMGVGYYGVWVMEGFWCNVVNFSIVVFFIVIILLMFGMFGGYVLV